MHFQFSILVLAGLAAASHSGNVLSRAQYTGIASFNNYSNQSNTVCGQKSGTSGTYGAAAGDISPDISGGKCSGSIDTSKCDGQGVIENYSGPSCPKTNCGVCYTVTNQGGFNGASVQGAGKSITVQIIDSCPAESAFNYCKTQTPANQRCGDSSTNQLDIDYNAYEQLTDTAYTSGLPNLAIGIQPTTCP
ncbi:hypothetical protein EV356DRAFT_580508 [Viridothelium virens]|uniref:Expansin-like EG45 domain-containing protein n=1 Tax=Viridothelium virens TaxID=1048519 RepID=A0A6A6GVP9_VIRVR|nr:hypothetical protein EV356DRAFT_580508 [Viridothelium virens]